MLPVLLHGAWCLAQIFWHPDLSAVVCRVAALLQFKYSR